MSTYAANYEQVASQLSASGPEWLDGERRAAFARFDALGFPTRRNEEWRYTNIAGLQKLSVAPVLSGPGAGFGAGLGDALAPFLLAGPDADRLVFVNGVYSAELSRVHEVSGPVTIGNLGALLAKAPERVRPYLSGDDGVSGVELPFAHLNSAYLVDGAFIHVPRGRVAERTVEVVFVTTPEASSEAGVGEAIAAHPRLVVAIEQGARAHVLENHVGLSERAYVSNAVTQTFVAQDAFLGHVKVQRDGLAAYHLGNIRAHLERGCTYENMNVSVGAALARNDINARLDGEGVSCTLDGLFLAGGEQHIDNHTSIDHAQPHCNSFQVYKGILAGRANAVFNGKIFVRQDAQKTNAKQSNRNLLLSPNASINTKPQLEIWADDVRCTHGATIGQLDADALFYLQARGVSRAEATSLLTHAFANEVIEAMSIEAARAPLGDLIHRWMDEQDGAASRAA